MILFVVLAIIVMDMCFFACGYSMDSIFSREKYKIEIKDKNVPKDKAIKGYEIMRKKTAVICSLARNSSDIMTNTQAKIERIGNKFKDYRVLIFENDSEDNTRQQLLEWQQKNPKIYVIPCGMDNEPLDCKLKEKNLYEYGSYSDSRMEKMARFRNIYLNLVKTQYTDYDYMIVYDFDIKGSICIDGLATSFVDDWDAIFVNGLMYIPGTFGLFYNYYDVLPLVKINDEFKIREQLELYTKYGPLLVDSTLAVGKPNYPVKSAFAGIGIYKIQSILDSNASYGSKYKCEHIELNEAIHKNGGKLYINPNALVYVGRQGPTIQTGLKAFISRFHKK